MLEKTLHLGHRPTASSALPAPTWPPTPLCPDRASLREIPARCQAWSLALRSQMRLQVFQILDGEQTFGLNASRKFPGRWLTSSRWKQSSPRARARLQGAIRVAGWPSELVALGWFNCFLTSSCDHKPACFPAFGAVTLADVDCTVKMVPHLMWRHCVALLGILPVNLRMQLPSSVAQAGVNHCSCRALQFFLGRPLTAHLRREALRRLHGSKLQRTSRGKYCRGSNNCQ